MRFWNIDLDDWISRRRFDEKCFSITFGTSGLYDINSWYDEFQNFRISLNGIRTS
jgi:hypothetical protein